MNNPSVFLLSIIAVAFCLLALWIITYTQNFIKSEGEKMGLSPAEINKWQIKALLYGGVFGVYLFKRELKKRSSINNK